MNEHILRKLDFKSVADTCNTIEIEKIIDYIEGSSDYAMAEIKLKLLESLSKDLQAALDFAASFRKYKEVLK